ncbi:B12-binding domain-containing radical SAM protein [Pendulispora albinea]|uniref:Radical SAM protein n=1 Tax=Pendulispora albinea TaxID=2741071 RepID=A0ABZ2M7V4_9BACT
MNAVRPGVFFKIALIDIDPRVPNITTPYAMPRHGVLEVGTAASLAGHDVSVFCESVNGIPWGDLASFDVVGAAVTGSNLSRVEELFVRLRRVAPHVRLVAGGPHATLSPTEVARFCDVVVRDEGELAFPEVLLAFSNGAGLQGIEGISYAKDGYVHHNPRRAFKSSFGRVDDLSLVKGFAKRPVWADVLLRKKYPVGYATTSRGCPFPCTFCYENMIGGTGFRRQPADVFIENVRRRRDFFGITHFWLADSNFTTNPKHCEEIAQALVRADLGCTFSALCRVDAGKRPRLLELLRRAGFVNVTLGMEATTDDRLLDLKKKQSVDEIGAAVRAMHNAGLSVMGLFMVGFDEDDETTADRIVDFCEAHEVDNMSIYCLTEYPELPGRTLPRYRVCETDLDYYTGHHVTTFPLLLPPSALERSVFRALQRFYRPQKIWSNLRRGQLAEAFAGFGIRTILRELAAVSKAHCAKLEALEEPYYKAYGGSSDMKHGRLDLEHLRKHPIVRHPLRADTLAGWDDPEPAPRLVQLRQRPVRIASGA